MNAMNMNVVSDGELLFGKSYELDILSIWSSEPGMKDDVESKIPVSPDFTPQCFEFSENFLVWRMTKK